MEGRKNRNPRPRKLRNSDAEGSVNLQATAGFVQLHRARGYPGLEIRLGNPIRGSTPGCITSQPAFVKPLYGAVAVSFGIGFLSRSAAASHSRESGNPFPQIKRCVAEKLDSLFRGNHSASECPHLASNTTTYGVMAFNLASFSFWLRAARSCFSKSAQLRSE